MYAPRVTGKAGTARATVLLGGAAWTLVLATSARSFADDVSVGSATEALTIPPHSMHAYIQYGVGLSAEGVASPGPLCKSVPLFTSLGALLPHSQSNNCILGSGGGVAVAVGWRPSEVVYLGGTYEMTKQDPNQLYRLGILQQVRLEWRRYFPLGLESAPFVLLGGGVHGYGNEWAIDTWGPDVSAGGGLEIELGGPVLDLLLAYRAMYFRGWEDTSGTPHSEGLAHFLAFEVSLEAKDAL